MASTSHPELDICPQTHFHGNINPPRRCNYAAFAVFAEPTCTECFIGSSLLELHQPWDCLNIWNATEECCFARCLAYRADTSGPRQIFSQLHFVFVSVPFQTPSANPSSSIDWQIKYLPPCLLIQVHVSDICFKLTNLNPPSSTHKKKWKCSPINEAKFLHSSVCILVTNWPDVRGAYEGLTLRWLSHYNTTTGSRSS